MRKYNDYSRSAVLFLAMMLLAGFYSQAWADVEIQKLPEIFDQFTVGMDVHTFYRGDSKPYYGAKVGATDETSVNWGEILARLRLSGVKDAAWARVTGQLAVVGMATVDQDVYGAAKDESAFDLNQANIKFGKLWQGPIDVTIGMQDVRVEKQFLIGIGRGQEAARWIRFNDSWPFAIQLDGEFAAMQAKLFWAHARNYLQTAEGKDDVQATGLNLHFNLSEENYLYGGVFAKLDDSGDAGFHESNTQNYDFGLDMTWGGLNLEAEGVYQTGDVRLTDGTELDRKAFGGFVSPKYTFPGSLSPYVKLHWIYFSGDDDLSDGDWTAWDPMFWGFPGWNRWVIGELAGETQLLNTNKSNYILEIGFSPTETMTISATYIIHRLNEKYFPDGVNRDDAVPVSSTDFAGEINLFMDWYAADHLFVHCGLGYAMPDKAAEEVYASDEDALFAQIWLWWSF